VRGPLLEPRIQPDVERIILRSRAAAPLIGQPATDN
jgi:hypothetical protein